MVVKTKSDDHFKHMIWTDEALDVEDEFKYFLDCLIQLEMQKNCIGTRIRFISMWVKVSKDEFFQHCMSIQLWTKHAYPLLPLIRKLKVIQDWQNVNFSQNVEFLSVNKRYEKTLYVGQWMWILKGVQFNEPTRLWTQDARWNESRNFEMQRIHWSRHEMKNSSIRREFFMLDFHE